MQVGNINITYLSHVCFVFASPAGRRVITDPFFAVGFTWKGRWERYLSPPAMPVEAIRECDLVFVSHNHGDHYDPAAALAIYRRTGAGFIAPADVCDDLSSLGIPAANLHEASDGAQYPCGDFLLTTYCGYDRSFDSRNRPNKFSLRIATRTTSLFYSGDCHELPPAVIGQEYDAMLMWPHTNDDRLRSLCAGIRTGTFILMHCDLFSPGDFMCNLDRAKQKARIEQLAPGMNVVVPERARSLP